MSLVPSLAPHERWTSGGGYVQFGSSPPEQARARIRAIADEMRSGEPAPNIRFALVSFRDRGDAYVTRVHDFTTDVDEMQRFLDGTRADGGGDGPEALLEGVHDAIRRL